MEVSNYFVESENRIKSINELLPALPVSRAPDRVVAAWEQGGLLSPGWANGELNRTWINVVAHNVVVAWTAYCLSDGDPTLVEAGLVHDAYKRREWEAGERAKRERVDRHTANREAELAAACF